MRKFFVNKLIGFAIIFPMVWLFCERVLMWGFPFFKFYLWVFVLAFLLSFAFDGLGWMVKKFLKDNVG